jgi:hypothetical protein
MDDKVDLDVRCEFGSRLPSTLAVCSSESGKADVLAERPRDGPPLEMDRPFEWWLDAGLAGITGIQGRRGDLRGCDGVRMGRVGGGANISEVRAGSGACRSGLSASVTGVPTGDRPEGLEGEEMDRRRFNGIKLGVAKRGSVGEGILGLRA